LPDYTRDDKTVIGKTFILPQKLKETGLVDHKVQVVFTDEVWIKLLDPYKWDSGMRTLQHTIGEICQKIARRVVETGVKKYEINASNLREYVLF